MNIAGLFPVPIGVTNLNREFTVEELHFIKNQERKKLPNNDLSTNTEVFKYNVLRNLHSFCLESVNTFVQEVYKPIHTVDMYITQSWVTYSNQNGSHHKHTHANSFISGILYVNAEENADNITFFKETPDVLLIEHYDGDDNPFNSDSWTVPVKTGDLIIFPSRLCHGVEPVKSKEERISLPFNTFFKGTLGTEKGLTLLHL